jgi:predicted Fe-Mo cluster-binding NifX family protein
MKIAVSSTGTQLDSMVDPRFGRARYLLIVDGISGEISEVLDNSAAIDAAHGAGINAASRIAEAKADVVLSGRVGPKAAAVCEKAGITMLHDMTGTVAEAVRQYLDSQQSQPVKQYETVGAGSSMAAGGGRRGKGGGCGTGTGGGRGMGRGGGCGRGR